MKPLMHNGSLDKSNNGYIGEFKYLSEMYSMQYCYLKANDTSKSFTWVSSIIFKKKNKILECLVIEFEHILVGCCTRIRYFHRDL